MNGDGDENTKLISGEARGGRKDTGWRTGEGNTERALKACKGNHETKEKLGKGIKKKIGKKEKRMRKWIRNERIEGNKEIKCVFQIPGY